MFLLWLGEFVVVVRRSVLVYEFSTIGLWLCVASVVALISAVVDMGSSGFSG